MEDQGQEEEGPPPVFDALTTSARQIFILLKCIGFMSKAQMQISSDGMRVTVEDSHVMQGTNQNTTSLSPPPPHPAPNSVASVAQKQSPQPLPPSARQQLMQVQATLSSTKPSSTNTPSTLPPETSPPKATIKTMTTTTTRLSPLESR